MEPFSFVTMSNKLNVLIGEEVFLLNPFSRKKNYKGKYDGFGNVGEKNLFFYLAMWNRLYILNHFENFSEAFKDLSEDIFFDRKISNETFYTNEKKYLESVRKIGEILYFNNTLIYPYRIKLERKSEYYEDALESYPDFDRGIVRQKYIFVNVRITKADDGFKIYFPNQLIFDKNEKIVKIVKQAYMRFSSYLRVKDTHKIPQEMKYIIAEIQKEN